MKLAVVMLDDARFGAGSGTVVDVTDEPISDVLKRHTDRDGARSERLRIWRAGPDCRPGDRVQAGVQAG